MARALNDVSSPPDSSNDSSDDQNCCCRPLRHYFFRHLLRHPILQALCSPKSTFFMLFFLHLAVYAWPRWTFQPFPEVFWYQVGAFFLFDLPYASFVCFGGVAVVAAWGSGPKRSSSVLVGPDGGIGGKSSRRRGRSRSNTGEEGEDEVVEDGGRARVVYSGGGSGTKKPGSSSRRPSKKKLLTGVSSKHDRGLLTRNRRKVVF